MSEYLEEARKELKNLNDLFIKELKSTGRSCLFVTVIYAVTAYKTLYGVDSFITEEVKRWSTLGNGSLERIVDNLIKHNKYLYEVDML